MLFVIEDVHGKEISTRKSTEKLMKVRRNKTCALTMILDEGNKLKFNKELLDNLENIMKLESEEQVKENFVKLVNKYSNNVSNYCKNHKIKTSYAIYYFTLKDDSKKRTRNIIQETIFLPYKLLQKN